jgi:hypothetical protein
MTTSPNRGDHPRSSSTAAPLLGVSKTSAGESGKTVHVKGYTKKDGTHVAPHDRKAPKDKGTTTTSKPASTHANDSASSAKRDEHGRIARSEAAKHAFEVQTGYPHGRPGYVVDHIRPLACGGLDAPSNMQWQTIAAAKAKDK